MSKKQKSDQPAVPVVETQAETFAGSAQPVAAEAAATDATVESATQVVPKVEPDTRPLFRLTHNGFTQEIHAVDEIAARAIFNDRRSVWPSPREVSVERL